LGSCLGDRLGYLVAARDAIAQIPGVRVLAASPIYETEPVGVRPEFDSLTYLNAVLIIETDRSPEDLRARLAEIEAAAGRVRSEDRYAPRTLDIDIIYFGDQRHAAPNLTVPHPRWAERRFVVQPLADVRPDRVLPGCAFTAAQRLAELPPRPAVRRFEHQW
jgi:2-amino-4-hydroxy-6-hydroxymethyldihydropteridine diphosphokinase